jgi:hypothetical protein
VHLHDDDEDDEGLDDTDRKGGSNSFRSRLRNWVTRNFGSGQAMDDVKPQTMHNGAAHDPTSGVVCGPPLQNLRTIQRYHGGPNQERMAFMEEKSALTAKNLAVCAEQVSIFVTSGRKYLLRFS